MRRLRPGLIALAVALGHAGLHLRRTRRKLAHGPAEIIQLALVFNFLALGKFQRFQ